MDRKRVSLLAFSALGLGLAACSDLPADQAGQGAGEKLERCAAPLGTITVIEDPAAPWYATLGGQYQLGSTLPMLGQVIQQSNCFVVAALLQSPSGTRAASDYLLSPSITFIDSGASRVGLSLGGLLGSVGAVIGTSLSPRSASALLTLADRSGAQVVAAEGSARNWDFGLIGGLLSGGVGVSSGYAETTEGKLIAAAFVDAYNGVVRAARGRK